MSYGGGYAPPVVGVKRKADELQDELARFEAEVSAAASSYSEPPQTYGGQPTNYYPQQDQYAMAPNMAYAAAPPMQFYQYVSSQPAAAPVPLSSASQAAAAAAQAAANWSKTSQMGAKGIKLDNGKKHLRTAAGQVWDDPTLDDWDPNDFRIFCGDLGNEVNDDMLTRAFSVYPSFQKARVSDMHWYRGMVVSDMQL
eukprot:Colp12_sorted_trinity150504_noHs@12112